MQQRSRSSDDFDACQLFIHGWNGLSSSRIYSSAFAEGTTERWSSTCSATVFTVIVSKDPGANGSEVCFRVTL